MSASDREPPYRPDLAKTARTHFVIADDYVVTQFDAHWKRVVLHVETALPHSVERYLQEVALSDGVAYAQSPLEPLTYTAVSHAEAAGLAHRDFARDRAFDEIEEHYFRTPDDERLPEA